MPPKKPHLKIVGSQSESERVLATLRPHEQSIVKLYSNGKSASQIAYELNLTRNSVIGLIQRLRYKVDLRIFGINLPPLEPQSYDGQMKIIDFIVNELKSWDPVSQARLALDLKNGKLRKDYEEASEATAPEVKSLNPSGWIPTSQLPPEIAKARRAADTSRKRASRANMSETQKAEERAKAAERMRAKRAKPPEP